MTETAKTGVFWVAAAAMAGIAAFVAWPRPVETDADSMVNKSLFESFTDPLAANSMTVVKFDEKLGSLSTFEVAKNPQTGQWAIPSRSGYPADAAEQMRDAATALLDLKVLDVSTTLAQDHAKYGVLEPDAEQLQAGDEGVGTLVTLRGEGGTQLVQLIIGNPDPRVPEQRFVRIPNQDAVYAVKLDPTPLSTDFKTWIKADLLAMSPWDIREVGLRDYSIIQALQGNQVVGALERNFDADVAVSESGQWSPVQLIEYDDDAKPRPIEMPADKQLNSEKLNALKQGLSELRIADVYRKPSGLSAELRAEEGLLQNREAVQSLFERGFYLAGGSDGKAELFGANGELILTLQTGVQYLLRFGDIAKIGEKEATNADSSTEGQAEEPADDATSDVQRFLLISARVDERQFPMPELLPVPQSVDELPPLTEDSIAPADGEAPQPETAEEKQERLEAEVERVTKENQRKIDERNNQLAVAREKVAELNARFADWYYVISDDTYRRLRLGRDELLTTAMAPGPGQTTPGGPAFGLPDIQFPSGDVPTSPDPALPPAADTPATAPAPDATETDPEAPEAPQDEATEQEQPAAEPAASEPANEQPASEETDPEST
jgi:hypothetical protein